MTNFYADNGVETVEFGSGFTFESAYKFILKADCDPDVEFLPSHDFIFVDDDGEEYIFEMDCWAPRYT